MNNKNKKFVKQIETKYPLANEYLEKNPSEARPTELDERGEGVESSITLQVFPVSGEIPDNDTTVEIWRQLKDVGNESNVEEIRLQFVVKGEDGKQNIIRNVKLMEPEECSVEVTTECGQKLVLLFNDKEHYDQVYPMMVERGGINKIVPEFIQDEPLVIGVQPLIFGGE